MKVLLILIGINTTSLTKT